MAVSGAVLLLFVVVHMLGNLQIFLGPEVLNRYAHFLQSTPEVLWPARMALLFMVGVHLTAAIQLSIENRAARPVEYAVREIVAASYASRTMLMSGLIVLVFIVYHLLHFTLEVPQLNLTGKDFAGLKDPQGRHDVFQMMIVGYSNPLVSGFYIVGMALLCLHISHGAAAMFQSLGFKNKRYGPALDRFGRALAVVIFLGNCSIPVAVLLGYGQNYRG